MTLIKGKIDTSLLLFSTFWQNIKKLPKCMIIFIDKYLSFMYY
jgi:hypothetical protein